LLASRQEELILMKAVIQRTDEAEVRVGKEIISAIKQGLLIFLGIEKGDKREDCDYLLEKTINLRIFEDDVGKMNRSLIEVSGELLIVSQFTLLADCRKGRRPSFTQAEEPQKAKALYDYFVEKAKQRVKKVSQGLFQEMMKVKLVNNGPVTIILDSKERR